VNMTRAILISLIIFFFIIFIKSTTSRLPPRLLRRNRRQIDEMQSEIVTEPITTPVMIKEDMDDDVMGKDKEENIAVIVEDEVENINDDVNEIKEDHRLSKCYKCKKPSYKYKNDEFCDLCVQENLVKSDEKDVNCKKCRKFKYRGKNSEFCNDNCPDEMKRPLFLAQQAIAELESGKETDDEVMEEEIDDGTTTSETTMKEKTTVSLGIMGSIYKFLVHANTWDFRPSNLPQAQVEEK